MTKCRHCGDQWTGLAMAHCTVCHHTFSVARNFDAHLKGNKHNHPSEVGLVEARIGLGGKPVWAKPGVPIDEARPDASRNPRLRKRHPAQRRKAA